MNENVQQAIENLRAYDKVRVTSMVDNGREEPFPNTVEGEFRARIVSPDNAAFDRNGSALWITAMFEFFPAIADIVELEITEPYNPNQTQLL